MDKLLKSEMHDQCNARPTVTFPAAELMPISQNQIIITFRVSHSRGKCILVTAVCVSVPHRIPTLLHGPGCKVREWYRGALYHTTPPQPFYGHFSGTTRVSWCQN